MYVRVCVSAHVLSQVPRLVEVRRVPQTSVTRHLEVRGGVGANDSRGRVRVDYLLSHLLRLYLLRPVGSRLCGWRCLIKEVI